MRRDLLYALVGEVAFNEPEGLIPKDVSDWEKNRMNARLRLVAVTLVLTLVLAETARAQCFLSRLFNPQSTYTAQYGGYNVGYAYMPVVSSPVVAPAAPTVSYRVTYLPVTPGATTVYRPAPVLYQPAVQAPVARTSYLPVVSPYAVPPTVSTTTIPTVAYRPVQIVYEPRRLFNWRPFANLRARRTGYWPEVTVPTWSTAYFATYPSVPVVSDCTVCGAGSETVSAAYVPSASSVTGCASCAPSLSSSWQPIPETSTPSLPPAGSSTQPPSTYKQESSSSTESRFKPADGTNGGTSASGTSAPVTETKPLVRQALFEKPIPLVEETTDPPMVEITGWRRSQ